MKLFFASCLVIQYRSQGFLRSAAFCAACARFSAHILLSFLAAFLTDLLASQYCLLRLVFSASLLAFNNLPFISLRFAILPHVSSEIQSFFLIFLLPNISSLASRRAIRMLCHFFSVLSLAFWVHWVIFSISFSRFLWIILPFSLSVLNFGLSAISLTLSAAVLSWTLPVSSWWSLTASAHLKALTSSNDLLHFF